VKLILFHVFLLLPFFQLWRHPPAPRGGTGQAGKKDMIVENERLYGAHVTASLMFGDERLSHEKSIPDASLTSANNVCDPLPSLLAVNEMLWSM
jgi:hypothetical protein